MTVLDTTIAAKVVSVLAKYGKSIDFYVTTGATYSPATGSVTGGSTAVNTVKGAPPYPYARQFINGDTILEGDARTLIAKPSTWAPKPEMKVVFDSTTWRVVSVEPIYSGDAIAAYAVQMRQ